MRGFSILLSGAAFLVLAPIVAQAQTGVSQGGAYVNGGTTPLVNAAVPAAKPPVATFGQTDTFVRPDNAGNKAAPNAKRACANTKIAKGQNGHSTGAMDDCNSVLQGVSTTR